MRLKENNIEFVCPICWGTDFSYKFSWKDYRYHTNKDKIYDIIECNYCKLECIYPQPSIEEQQSFYPICYYSYVEINKTKLSKFKKIISNIGSIAASLFNHKKLNLPSKKGNWKNFLDIGCGAWENLNFMKSKWWNVKWFEIWDKIEYKNNIYYWPSITEINFFEKYDYIWCHHVFEHVYNPTEFLKKCDYILNDDWIMVVNLPNVKSFSSKVYWKYAVDRDIPRHIFWYNYQNIQTLFKNSWFEIVYKNYQQNYWWLSSFSRYIYDKYNKNISNNLFFKGVFMLFDIVLSLFKPTNSMWFVLKKGKK